MSQNMPRPAGPPAVRVRPRRGGIGRSTSREAEAVSDALRRGSDDLLQARRRVAGAALVGIASLGVVAAYQTGVVKHLPDPPLGPFHSDAVDAAGEAYAIGHLPDAALGIGSYAITLILAVMGGRDRHRQRPWVPLALLTKAAYDAVSSAYLTAEQASKHRRFCSYCLVAAAAAASMLPNAIPEARAALVELRRLG